MRKRSSLASGPSLFAGVDTGPLYAAVDADDEHHEVSLAALQTMGVQLVIPAMVVAETTYLVGSRLGARTEARFLRALEDFDVAAPVPEDWQRIAEVVSRYAKLGLGGTDASVIALAERLGTDLVITLARRHFGVVRPRHCRSLRILPER